MWFGYRLFLATALFFSFIVSKSWPVIGGSRVHSNLPIVALSVGDSRSEACSAVKISSKRYVTALHCLADYKCDTNHLSSCFWRKKGSIKDSKIKISPLKKIDSYTFWDAKALSIKSVCANPSREFDSSNKKRSRLHNDLAFIDLESEPENLKVLPNAEIMDPDISSEKIIRFYGYGCSTHFAKKWGSFALRDHLKVGRQKVVWFDRAAYFYGDLKNKFVGEGIPFGEACHGDSGGAVTLDRDRQFSLVGIVKGAVRSSRSAQRVTNIKTFSSKHQANQHSRVYPWINDLEVKCRTLK